MTKLSPSTRPPDAIRASPKELGNPTIDAETAFLAMSGRRAESFEFPELSEPFEFSPHDPPDFLWIEIESPAPTPKCFTTAG